MGLFSSVGARAGVHVGVHGSVSSASLSPVVLGDESDETGGAAFSVEEAPTRRHAVVELPDDPTIERPVPDAVAAAARDEEFRTGRVTFEEILARVGPQHLGGPLPPIRDELYTTTPDPADADREPLSTDDLDGAWSDEP